MRAVRGWGVGRREGRITLAGGGHGVVILTPQTNFAERMNCSTSRLTKDETSASGRG